jgi:dephospho-CoA kinase
MIKIVVIGEIGSGKTFVANEFGYPVFDADKQVSKIYKNDKKCFFQIKKKFPKENITYPIKKSDIRKLILKNQKNIFKINKIVHPIVRNQMKKFIYKNKNMKGVVLDIPLFLENKLNKKGYILVYVQSKKKDINKRLKLRIGYSLKLLNILKKLQLSIELKKKKSHFIIKNNFKKFYLKKNVKLIKNKILENERSSS